MPTYFDAQIVLDSFGWLVTALLGGVGVGWVYKFIWSTYSGWIN